MKDFVKFTIYGRDLVSVPIPDRRPCLVEFPVPDDWTDYREIGIETYDADGALVERLHPTHWVTGGDWITVTVWKEFVTKSDWQLLESWMDEGLLEEDETR